MLPNIIDGTIHTSNNYGNFTVVNFINSSRVLIQFIDTHYERYVTSDQIRKGTIKDPYKPVIAGVGYVGEGDYKTTDDNGKHHPYYTSWRNILHSCYDITNKSYKYYGAIGVIVCNEWHCYQNFCKWCDNNWFDGCDIAKELKDNKLLYSPETVTITTHKINTTFHQAKYYQITNPNGEPIKIYNLKQFCRDNNLNFGSMQGLLKGQRKSVNKYTKLIKLPIN